MTPRGDRAPCWPLVLCKNLRLWPLDRSKWHPCTSQWRDICRPGRIDHWMYMKDNTQALINYNACSMYRPSGPGWQLCL